jgi:riboflavin biosynthesis pyrimidine reductase
VTVTKILRVVVDRTGERTERAVVVCRRRRVVVVIVATEFASFHNPD